MKAKRVALLVSIISLILIFVVLSSTLFSLNRVEFCFLQNPVYYRSLNASDVVASGEFQMGQSVFFVDKQKHIAKIEKDYPHLKIAGIETIFPNILLIQSLEREEFIAVPNSDNSKLAICDGEFKILRIIAYSSVAGIPILDGGAVQFSSQSEGDFLNLSQDAEFLKNLQNYFSRIGYSSKAVASILKGAKYENSILKLFSYNNYRIEIKAPDKFLLEKLALAYKTIFGDQGVSEDFCGLIKVYQQENKILANVVANG